MEFSRPTRLSLLAVMLTALGACGKEEPPAQAPAAPTTAPAQPAPAAPTPAPTAPAPGAPASDATSAPGAAPASPAASSASASDPAAEKLASANGCLACHTTDKKVIGPPYREVAQKYAGQADAEQNLFNSVKNGSQGKWGPIPMPPNPQVKDDDIRTLVRWILAQK